LPSIAREFYAGLADELAGRLRRIASFTGHAGASGYYHEEILREVLRTFLGSRYSLRTGFVYLSPERVSRQLDIMIVDEDDPTPYLYRHGDFAVVHPRALGAFIEVKTRLDKAGFRDALAVHRSVIAQLEEERLVHPLGFVFAFESPQYSHRLLDAWYRSVSLDNVIQNYPNVICSMTAGAIVCGHSPPGHHVILEPTATGQRVNAFSLFLATIKKVLEMRRGIHSNPYKYAFIDGMMLAHETFCLGQGSIGLHPVGGAP